VLLLLLLLLLQISPHILVFWRPDFPTGGRFRAFMVNEAKPGRPKYPFLHCEVGTAVKQLDDDHN
jgi:hypothetical protein